MLRNGAVVGSCRRLDVTFTDVDRGGRTTYSTRSRPATARATSRRRACRRRSRRPPASRRSSADGFESGTLSAWTSSGGLVAAGHDRASGSFAAEGNTTNGSTYAKKTLPATYTDGFGRVYFNVKSAASQVNLLRFRTAADGSLGYVFVTATGQVGFRNDVAATTTMSSARWHGAVGTRSSSTWP